MVKNLQFAIAILITIFFGSHLYSQLPTKPVNLNADISFNGTDYEMILSWQAGTSHTMTDLFNIYVATGNTENPGDFTLISTLARNGDETAVYAYSHTFTVTGSYSVYVTGQNGLGEGPASDFLHVHTGPALISGRVFQDNYEMHPIPYADVTVKAMAPPDTTYYYYTTANDSGYFEIEVPDGNYKVFVGGDYCYDMWYQNAETEEQATVISAKYGNRTYLTIESRKMNLMDVKGTVKEKSTGYPIFPATVDFMAFTDNKLIKTISVPTASDGSYTITLSAKYEYKILAYDNFSPRKYIPMYYVNSYDFLEAEFLSGNRLKNQTMPNFELEEFPASLNKINGVVRDNLGNGVKSMLILYKHQFMSGVRTVESDENGNFTFKNLEPGKYIIRAMPYGSYTSGFYNTKDYVEPHWFDATLINVDENTEFLNHLIIVNPITYPQGKYLIEGWVMENQNAIEGKNEKVQDEIYIGGAVAYLMNSKMETVAVDYSGFSFPNLASDHYTLKVDKIGYEFYTSDDIYVNEIDTSKFVKVYLNKHPHTNPTISFKSIPPTEAFVGQSYSYDAEAVTNSIDSIRYDLIESPQGMSVNGCTGLINWTPKREGTFTVILEAYLVNNPTITIQQTWSIEVKEGEKTAFLSVLVKNAERVFPDATLKLYPSDFSATFTAISDAQGKAFFSLPAGDYYLHLSGNLFEDCWYNNRTDFKDADVISLTAGDTLEINPMVTEKKVTYKISGIVADSKSAIPEASVHFILETGEIRTVLTDANGRFSFEIGKDTAFRAFAVKDGQYTAQYYPEYYDFAEVPLLKNINKADFNFNLEQLPKSTVSIEGKILNESAIPITGVVVAYGGDFVDDGTALKFHVNFINSTVAKDGNYNLSVPISGNYILRAYPANQNYYP
ncbi:carboxypeptidase regulatory-like domain-containing protein, partial [Bacteroidetes/Chlorobi group bacterium ChocPot_Mid]